MMIGLFKTHKDTPVMSSERKLCESGKLYVVTDIKVLNHIWAAFRELKLNSVVLQTQPTLILSTNQPFSMFYKPSTKQI